jgi:LysM repeat protein
VIVVPDVRQVCPYLGISDDPATHYAFPSVAHRCYASDRPITLESEKQARDCLTGQHVTCSLYHRPISLLPTGGRLRAALAGPALEHVEATAGARPAPRRAQSTRRRVAELVLLVVLMIGAGASILLLMGSRLATQMSGEPSGDVLGAAASVAVPAKPSPSAKPAASKSAAPTTATPAPPTATTAPTTGPANPPARLIYTVVRGDYLIAIANRYGVTVAELRKVNNIPEPNLIYAGQKIVIPR